MPQRRVGDTHERTFKSLSNETLILTFNYSLIQFHRCYQYVPSYNLLGPHETARHTANSIKNKSIFAEFSTGTMASVLTVKDAGHSTLDS